MHILVTDVVTCPRCGPDFGLIVLADRIEDRHVLEGWLGCANCREQYRVRGGVADLRWGDAAAEEPESEQGTPGGQPDEADRALRIAALLGITGAASPVVMVTPDAALVAAVQAHLPDTGVIGLSTGTPGRGGGVGMGWLLASGAIPVRSRSLGGVVLASPTPAALIADALRSLSRGARLVIDPAPEGTAATLVDEGAEVLLEQDQVAVAFDPRAG